MPLSYEIDSARNLVVLTGRGGLSAEDVLKGRAALAADPHMKAGMLGLVDLRSLSGFELAGREVFTLAQSHVEFPFLSPESRTAIVVRDAAAFALARMYVLSRRKDAEPMAIFYDVAEAWSWLGLDPGDLPKELSSPEEKTSSARG
jgi:hypothetical protein